MDDRPILKRVERVEDFERVIEAASRVQRCFPEAVLVGGTASALHAHHRFSADDDHVIAGLKDRFPEVLETMEQLAGWKTRWVTPPVQILGNLNGVQTGIRNLRRSAPLETTTFDSTYGPIKLPTLPEMARIKAWLVVTRNNTRDYIDFVALAERIRELSGSPAVSSAILRMDVLYPQKTGESVVRQLAKQLCEPRPRDYDGDDLSKYRILNARWKTWTAVTDSARKLGAELEIARNRGDRPREQDDRSR
jgi:hypothetical protein